MKLSKKILAAFSAATLLATAAVFTSCTEEDDDTEGAISGSGKNYSINYTNSSSSDIYRCWNTTTFKHEGELVKIVINNQTSTSHDGVMGFVWDLCQSKDAATVTEGTTTTSPAITEKGYRNFFVVGFQWHAGIPRYYVSKFFNVTDLQANNFGSSTKVTTHKAGITATEPTEIVCNDADDNGWTTLSGLDIADDKSVTVWLDIYPVFENSTYGANIAAHSSTDAGSYVVDIYDADPTDESVTANKLDTVIIDPSVTGYSAEPSQNTLAVYANVQPSKTLNGTWYLGQDYAADEVVEE